MPPVSVLYILPPTGKFAGIERVVDEVADEIARSLAGEIDVSVLHMSDYPGFALGPRAYRTRTCDVDGRLDLMLRMRSEVRDGGYDLVIVPQIEATVIAWFACLGLGKRLVVHLHGNPRHENTHAKARILFGVFRALVLHRLAGVFGTSPKQLATFGRDFPSRVPATWTPNPVRRLPTRKDRPASDPQRVVFVNVGRFCYQKGQDLILDAFSDVLRQRPAARLILVGYGSEETALLAQVRRLGIDHAVSFEHHPHDPASALANADIYVSLSRWEGWSLAICEALRLGLPVVSSDCDFGPSDILTDPRLGRLVASGDRAAAVQAMLSYHDDIEAEREHSAFRTDYIARFDAETVAREHASAIISAIGATGALRDAAPSPAR